jgi:transposase-like protein
MQVKVKPSEEKNKQYAALLGTEGAEAFKNLIKVGMEKLLQEALEGEATEFLGRDWYKRKENDKELKSYRNGYYDRQVKTSSAILNLRKPRIRNNREEFESRILERLEYPEENVTKRLSQ